MPAISSRQWCVAAQAHHVAAAIDFDPSAFIRALRR
jgi:hypothetical protein